MKRLALSLAFLLSIVSASAQSVQQSGNITPGHIAYWVGNGIIADGGSAASGNLTSLGVTNNGGPGICVNSGPITGAYNQLCFAVSTSASAQISLQNFGGATAQSLTFNINGTVQGFPSVSPLPVVVNDVPCFSSTAGALKDCTAPVMAGIAYPIGPIAMGDLIYADTTASLARLADVAVGSVLISGGVNVAPVWSTALTLGAPTGGGCGAGCVNVASDLRINNVSSVITTRTIGTTAPITGGGDLSTNRTIACGTCATTTNGGALSGTAPVAISAAGAISLNGLAGGVLAGAGPAFTPTPTLGASGTPGSLTFGNAISGLLTVQPVTGALGTVTVSFPAITDTLITKTSPDTLLNKTYDTAGTGNAFKVNGTTVTTASDILKGICSTQGNVLYYNGTNWVCLAVGTSGQLLASGGPAANVSWVTASGTGTMTSVTQGAGVTATPNPITGAGTVQLDAAYQRGLLYGCNTSGSVTTLTINPCVSVDDGPNSIMLQSNTYTKTFAAWAVGTANGGLDTGAIANNTWYHVYQIQRSDTGVVDYLISTSATAPTMPTNYNRKRRIASIKTNATPNIIAYVQDGDLFQWSTDVADITATNPGTAAVTRTLASVPLGVRNEAIVGVNCSSTATNEICAAIAVSDLSVTDQAPGVNGADDNGNFTSGASTNSQMALKVRVMTNTSQQVRSRIAQSGASTSLVLVTHGWIDTRGRYN